jgi:hypothetical protein
MPLGYRLAVLGHHPGTFPITKGWFSLSGIDGQGDPVAGFLIAVGVRVRQRMDRAGLASQESHSGR